jgi:dihydrofolate reductase
MGKVVYSMLMSLDGYIARPDGEIGLPVPEDALHEHFNEAMRRTAVSLNGRRMYEMMSYWDSPGEVFDGSQVELGFAHAWQATPKIVFSRTLKEVGPNARLADAPLETVARSLKAEVEGEIAVSGADLAGQLAVAGLIDEYQLYLQPVVLGGGRPYFAHGLALNLELLGTERLTQGTTLLRYAPAG